MVFASAASSHPLSQSGTNPPPGNGRLEEAASGAALICEKAKPMSKQNDLTPFVTPEVIESHIREAHKLRAEAVARLLGLRPARRGAERAEPAASAAETASARPLRGGPATV